MTRYRSAALAGLTAIVISLVFGLWRIPSTAAVSATVVISEFRTRGPAGGNDEFFELFNLSSTNQDISGWKINGSNNAGGISTRLTIAAGTVLQPGQHYLAVNRGSSGYSGSVTGDNGVGTFTTGIGDDGGVALLDASNAIIDQVGLSTGSAYKEGTPLAAFGGTNSDRSYRRINECTDTDNNSADFGATTVTPSTPQNLASTLTPCTPPAGNLSFSSATYTVAENGTSATITVNRTSGSSGTVTVQYTTGDGTATAGADYTTATGTLTFTTGVTTTTFPVPILDDGTDEPDETVTLTLSNPTGGATITGTNPATLTITDDDAAPPAGSLAFSTAAYTVTESTATALITVTRSGGSAGTVAVDYVTSNGTATAGSDYITATGTITFTTDVLTQTFTVSITDDAVDEPDETVTLTLSNPTGGASLGGPNPATLTITDDDVPIACATADTAIGQVQGSGAATSLSGSVTIQGVVVGDYEGASPSLRGFYIQDSGDSNTQTSDGIFVFEGDNANRVAVGQVVQVTGTVSENQGQTQLSSTTGIELCGSTSTVTPTDVTLPFPAAVSGVDYAERFEGMLVRFAQTLYVTEHFQLGRFGQVLMSSGDRLRQPTNITTPGAPAAAQQAANDLNKIIVDDELQNQNRDPILFGRGGQQLTVTNTLRIADTATNIVGTLTYTWSGNAASGNAFRLRPVGSLGGGVPNFQPTNPRPATVPNVGGTLRIAGMNLLNFFNTFDGLPDNVDNCSNGAGGAATDCRGADTQAEFDRQWPKTVAAIIGTNADVIGLVEIENDGYGSTSAIQFLVDRLNAATAAGTYALIDVDARTGQTNALGTDAIKVGFLYKPAKVSLVGTTAALNTTTFVNGGDNAPRNRPSLAQAFQETATGEVVIVDINHLKSKGSACTAPDAGDGQGNCNVVRTNAANELTAWLAGNPTGTGDTDILIMGDLNAYAREDPITAIEGAGYTNLIRSLNGDTAYSYVFDGQSGYLDHALASTGITSEVTGVAEWHINADEPTVLDYNTDFKTANQQNILYAPDQFRIADHDPVLVGLNLQPQQATQTATATTGANTATATTVANTATATATTVGNTATATTTTVGNTATATATTVGNTATATSTAIVNTATATATTAANTTTATGTTVGNTATTTTVANTTTATGTAVASTGTATTTIVAGTATTTSTSLPGTATPTRTAGPAPTPVQLLYAVTDNNRLLSFSSSAPGTISTTQTITGLQANETLGGLDFRPATGQLFALGSTNRLYTINLQSGQATAIGTSPFTSTVVGTALGFDFNPAVDRIRLTSNTGRNLRLNPFTGGVGGVDGQLQYSTLDPGATTTPRIVGAAYTNNIAGTQTTSLYVIDAQRDVLALQGSINGAPTSPNTGTLFTVGALGIDASDVVAFDIGANNIGFALITTAGLQVQAPTTELYTIDLNSGRATRLGALGTSDGVRGLAIPIALFRTYLPFVAR